MTREMIVPVTWPQVRKLADVMREADAREAWAAGRLTPTEALRTSMEASCDPGAVLVDGRVICVFGVAEWSVLALLGVPWLLASKEMPQHARKLIRESKRYMQEVRKRYKLLQNHVDARNTEAVRWLRWLEFEIDPALPFGPDQLPFHRFHWEAP